MYTRRDLLKAGAGAGAAALLADPVIQAALAASPRPGTLEDIEHVVILIQENRSFDHYFGMMPGVNGYAQAVASGVYAQPGYPVEGYEGVLMPFHLQTNGAPQCFPDITHQWGPQHESWDSGAMDGFIRAHLAVDGPKAGPATMGYYERADIPFYWALAEAFTLCDGYHCSVLGPTDPNRLLSMTATLDPEGGQGGPLIETLEGERSKYRGTFTWQTMPEALSAAGISWKIYNGTGGGLGDNVLTYFKSYVEDPALAALAFEPTYPEDFVADIAAGTLPQVVWINASLDETEHPGYSTAAIGEHTVSKLLRSIWGNAELWSKVAVFITWDENGGFFDHVPPPTPPPGTAGEYLTVPDLTGAEDGYTGPVGLGFRVPALVISEYSRGGFLCSDRFDHTSLLRFLETRFGVEVPNLSAWRRSTTGDMTSSFNFVERVKSHPKLPRVPLSPAELMEGGCATSGPVTVPPNSVPQQPSGGSWRTPSGPT
ncbi:MAG TPA: alkaline phosphatase family protein [Solirubrobacteraceae bacterium]|nr:alkaline phosphatase family protein [Solirubrobacteraceae bacterium]